MIEYIESFSKKYLKEIIIVCVTFIFFFSINYSFYQQGFYIRDDILFGADPFRAVGDMTMYLADHNRSSVHPIFTLLIYFTLGSFFNVFTQNGFLSSIIISSCISAFSVLVFWLILREFKLDDFKSAVFTLLFQFSSSTLIFLSMPESYGLTVLSLEISLLVYLQAKDKSFLKTFFYPTIIAVGTTITNIYLPFILLYQKFQQKIITKKNIRRFVIWLVFTIVFLSLIQKITFPKTQFLFSQHIFHERVFLSLDSFQNSFSSIPKYLNTFFIFSVIGPNFVTKSVLMSQYVGSIEISLSEFNIFQIFSILLFSVLIIWVCFQIIRRKIYLDKIVRIFVLAISFHFILHLFYSTKEIFLFSAHFTFLYILLIAYTISRFKLRKIENRYLILSVFLIILNNVYFLQKVLNFNS